MPLIDRTIAPEVLEALYALVMEEDRKGKTQHHRALNWMVLGHGIARAITGQPFREPTWGEYAALVLLVGVVEVVEPEGRHSAAEIRKFAATCWEGVGC